MKISNSKADTLLNFQLCFLHAVKKLKQNSQTQNFLYQKVFSYEKFQFKSWYSKKILLQNYAFQKSTRIQKFVAFT